MAESIERGGEVSFGTEDAGDNGPDDMLIDYFAAFYEDVAEIKLAIHEGRLPAYLTRQGHPPPTDAMELAAMVSSRLKNRLQAQAREVRDSCTETQQKAHRLATYVMAALADEIFLLDEHTRWEGRDSWLYYLLERALFRSGSAGRDFFTHLDLLLQSRLNDDLRADLASVFLIALQLGFQGQHRGDHGAASLASYRQRLLHYIRACRQPLPDQAAFQQAYDHLLAETTEHRLAPLASWYRAGGIALAAYLVLSSIVWFAIVLPFTSHFSPG
jgi:type VI secretion system protein ImpK